MSARFLLPCPCGKSIPVAISQAGTNVVCPCGQTVPVPSVRGLKALPTEKVTEEATSQLPPAAEINGVNLKGAAFVLGFLLLIGGIALSAWEGYVVYRVDTKDYTQVDEEYVSGRIDELGVMEIYNNWKEIERTGLGEHEMPPHVMAREFSASAIRFLCGGIGLIVVGLGLCVYSFSGSSAVRRKT